MDKKSNTARLMAIGFYCSNSLQVHFASQVIETLRSIGEEVCYFDLNSSGQKKLESEDARRPRLRSIVRALRFKYQKGISVVVFQQDVGVVEKILIQRAKKLGLTVSLIPDGMVWDNLSVRKFGVRKVGATFLLHALKALDIIGSVDRNWFSSQPDLVFLWGAAWKSSCTRLVQTSEVLISGCPRFNTYKISAQAQFEHILLVSNPVENLGLTKFEISKYYEQIIEMHARYDGRLRLRLHPFELVSPLVPIKLKQLHSEAVIEADLAWASDVISPVSTVLLEGAILGKKVGYFFSSPTIDQLRESNAFFRFLKSKLDGNQAALKSELPLTVAIANELFEFIDRNQDSAFFIANRLRKANVHEGRL